MLKKIHHEVWAFDAEWVPDPVAGRTLYDIPPSVSDSESILEMWRQGGATAENPRPFLKTVLCRVVSISAVVRRVARDGSCTIDLLSLPRDPCDVTETEEATIIDRFLSGVGKFKPQLVGYNSSGADLRILIQRGIVNGLHQPMFGERPNKPWEGVDYFAKESEFCVDLMNLLSPWGRSPSLHEIATLSGIPGKMDTDGEQVAELWLQGDLARIVAYNEFDALTTYLLWLRMAHFGGQLSPENYKIEQERLRSFILERVAVAPHLGRYLECWDRCRH